MDNSSKEGDEYPSYGQVESIFHESGEPWWIKTCFYHFSVLPTTTIVHLCRAFTMVLAMLYGQAIGINWGRPFGLPRKSSFIEGLVFTAPNKGGRQEQKEQGPQGMVRYTEPSG